MKRYILSIFSVFVLLPFLSFAQDYKVQINNGGFEKFEAVGLLTEPVSWNSTPSMSTNATTVPLKNVKCLEQSTVIRPGTQGTSSVKLFAALYTVPFVGTKIIIPGVMSTGKFQFTELSQTSANNYNSTVRNENAFNHPFKALPDSFVVWVKYEPISDTTQGAVAAFIHKDTDFKIRANGTVAIDEIVGTAALNYSAVENKGWQRLSIPFDYNRDLYTWSDPAYILINFSSSQNEGDAVYVDDIEIIYNKKVTTNPLAETSLELYQTNASITIPFTVNTAMFKGTTFKAQLSDANGSFDNPTEIGTLTATAFLPPDTNLSISATILANTPASTNYRIRVKSTNFYQVEGSPIDITIKRKYAAPANFKITIEQEGNCSAKLEWETPEFTDVVGAPIKYKIYRDGESLAETTNLSFLDGNISSNKNYTWGVSSVYTGDIEDDAVFEVARCNRTLPPVNVTINTENCNAEIAWEKPEGVTPTGYKILKGGTVISNLPNSTLSFIDVGITPFTEYQWCVRAMYDEYESVPVCILGKCSPLYPPVNLTVSITKENCNAKLTWSKPANGTPTSYNLYRNNELIQSNITNLFYEDNEIASLVPFEWCVKAVYDNGEESEGLCKKDTCIAYRAPSGLTATVNDTNCNVTLNWLAPGSYEHISYNVYRNNTLVKSGISELVYVDSIASKKDFNWCVEALYDGTIKSINNPCVTKKCQGLGVDIVKSTSFELYPNPANTQISIKGTGIKKVEIFNVLGQLQETKYTNFGYIDLKNYKPGVYIFKIYTDNMVSSRRVIVKR